MDFLLARGESSRKLDKHMTWLEWHLVTGHENVMGEEARNAGGEDKVRIDESMNGGAEEKPKPKRDKTRVTKAQHDRVVTAAANRAPGAGINASGSAEPQERDPEQEPRQTKRPSGPKAKPEPKAEPKPEAEETNVEPEKLPPAVWNSDPALAARLADF